MEDYFPLQPSGFRFHVNFPGSIEFGIFFFVVRQPDLLEIGGIDRGKGTTSSPKSTHVMFSEVSSQNAVALRLPDGLLLFI